MVACGGENKRGGGSQRSSNDAQRREDEREACEEYGEEFHVISLMA
jgi:hypothetical protein